MAASLFASTAHGFAVELKVGDSAPAFTARTDQNRHFDIQDRKGKWTVLYFYPKSGTPGCTKQACAFRDDIEAIRWMKKDVDPVLDAQEVAEALRGIQKAGAE